MTAEYTDASSGNPSANSITEMPSRSAFPDPLCVSLCRPMFSTILSAPNLLHTNKIQKNNDEVKLNT